MIHRGFDQRLHLALIVMLLNSKLEAYRYEHSREQVPGQSVSSRRYLQG